MVGGQAGQLGEGGLAALQRMTGRRQLGAVQVQPGLGFLLVGDGGIARCKAFSGRFKLFLDGVALRLDHVQGILCRQHGKVAGGHLFGQALQGLRQTALRQQFGYLGLLQTGRVLRAVHRNAQVDAGQPVVVVVPGEQVGVQLAVGGAQLGTQAGPKSGARCLALLVVDVHLQSGGLYGGVLPLRSIKGFLQVGGPGGQGGQQQRCQQQAGEPMCLDHCPSVCVARRVSVPGHGRILLHGPGVNAASQIMDLGKAMVRQEVDRSQAAHAMVADADDGLLGIQLVHNGGQLGQRHVLRLGQADVFELPFLAHVQQQGRFASRVSQPLGQLCGREAAHLGAVVRNGNG